MLSESKRGPASAGRGGARMDPASTVSQPPSPEGGTAGSGARASGSPAPRAEFRVALAAGAAARTAAELERQRRRRRRFVALAAAAGVPVGGATLAPLVLRLAAHPPALA